MATSLLALLDDIATVLDDVALLTKVAAKKTAGVLGDDLALNAQQVSGVAAERELPVVWAVAKGSAINKAILVPAALLISAFVPWLVTPVLMIGGAYLCYEGFEKVAHRWLHSTAEDEAHHQELIEALSDPSIDLEAVEKEKIKGAIRTDFILSAEIIVIALGTVASSSIQTQIFVLIGVAILMTFGVYGFVAAIVKMDDAGFYLRTRSSAFQRALGNALVTAAPPLLKFLTFAGTAAMFLVGGGIISHGVSALHHLKDQMQVFVDAQMHSWLTGPSGLLVDALVGMVVGAAAVLATQVWARLFRRQATANHD